MKKEHTHKENKPKKEAAHPARSTIEGQVIENLIALQKINLNLTEKFDKLSNQISELLTLFEMTARSFAKQAPAQVADKDKEFLDKINMLLEQNKTIAKGLTLMEMKLREKIYGPVAPQERPMPTMASPRPLPPAQWKPQQS